jgi:3'(2'), 5'-bisphosphate nucleotidase
VAEGESDLYVRMGRTMEWDTAAGHCILEEAGCKVVEASTGLPLKYGKRGFANPSFIASRGDLILPVVTD